MGPDCTTHGFYRVLGMKSDLLALNSNRYWKRCNLCPEIFTIRSFESNDKAVVGLFGGNLFYYADDDRAFEDNKKTAI